MKYCLCEAPTREHDMTRYSPIGVYVIVAALFVIILLVRHRLSTAGFWQLLVAPVGLLLLIAIATGPAPKAEKQGSYFESLLSPRQNNSNGRAHISMTLSRQSH